VLQAVLVFLAVFFGMSPQSPVTCRDRNSIAFCPAFSSAVSAPGVATSWQVKQRLLGGRLHERRLLWVDLGLRFESAARSGAANANALHARGRRLSVRAVKGAGVRRSSERSNRPLTEEADGAGAGLRRKGSEVYPPGTDHLRRTRFGP